MIAAELAQRYSQGESLNTLAHEYHMGSDTVSKLVKSMGLALRVDRRPRCQRCEILLRFDPGQDGYCGECWREVR